MESKNNNSNNNKEFNLNDHQNQDDKDIDRFQLLRKTELCKFYMEGKCPRNKENCAYAHGTDDLRVVSIDEKAKMHLLPSAKKWRTELCFNYTTTGTCRYGNKCAFIHDEVSYLKCKNIPVKDALQFIMESRQNQEQADFNMINNQLSGLKVDIPSNSYAFSQYATSPPYEKQAFTPMPYNTYTPSMLSPTAFTPYQRPNFFIYPKNIPNQKQYIGTPYPQTPQFPNYSYDAPESSTRSYRLFSRQAKTPNMEKHNTEFKRGVEQQKHPNIYGINTNDLHGQNQTTQVLNISPNEESDNSQQKPVEMDINTNQNKNIITEKQEQNECQTTNEKMVDELHHEN